MANAEHEVGLEPEGANLSSANLQHAKLYTVNSADFDFRGADRAGKRTATVVYGAHLIGMSKSARCFQI